MIELLQRLYTQHNLNPEGVADLLHFHYADGDGGGGDGGEGGDKAGDGDKGGSGAGDKGGDKAGEGDGDKSGEGEDGGDKDGGLTKEQLTAELAKTRREAASHRTKGVAKQKELDAANARISEINKILGIDDPSQSPEKIKQQLDETTAKFRQERLRNVVIVVAGKQQADPTLTWALLQSGNSLKDVDIEATDLETQVGEMVTALVTEHPKLKTDEKPARGGADRESGASGDKGNDMNARIRRFAGRTS